MALSDDIPLAWQALRADPTLFDDLGEAEALALAYAHDLWLRPSQLIPVGAWRYFGFIAGRGFGKSYAIACEINRRVEAGECTHPAIMAPTEERVDVVQVALLVETSPPWFKAESYLGGAKWPNGVVAVPYTSKEPDGPRGPSHDLAWLTEPVAWDPTHGLEGFNNITTATRRGRRPQVFWDTTSKGTNEIIAHLLAQNARDPARFPIRRGTMFDNPCLDPEYIKDELAKYVVGSRRYREEVLGEVLPEAAGALWQEEWINRTRCTERPAPAHAVIAIDPAQSIGPKADDTGIVRVERPLAGPREAYATKDLTGHHTPEAWGDLAIAECVDNGAAGIVVERNNACEYPAFVLRSRLKNRSDDWRVEIIPSGDSRPIPERQHGVVFVKEIWATESKASRAQPVASEHEGGRVHIVGSLPDLESQLLSWVPGRGKSPNRLDAFVHGVTEALELWRDTPGFAAAAKALPDLRIPRVLRRM